MSYERAMDPSDDPERRQSRRRPQKCEQLELPFSESARPGLSEDELHREIRELRAEIQRLEEKLRGPEQA